jgi:hypothetical protein
MTKARIFLIYICLYVFLSLLDTVTTHIGVSHSSGLIDELNLKFQDVSIYTVFITQIAVLPIFLGFIFIALSFTELPRSVHRLFAFSHSRTDFFLLKVIGAIPIAVLLVMLFGVVNNIFTLAGVGSIAGYLLSLLFDDVLHKKAFIPLFTSILIIFFMPFAYIILSKLTNRLGNVSD